MSKLRHVTTPRIPTRYVHLVSCFGSTWVLTSIDLSTSDHPAVQKVECKTMHVPTGWDPYMVKGLCLLLRDKHKGRPNFHP